MSTPKKIAIIGGGVTGLSAAYYLTQQGVAFTLFESSERLGGKIKTDLQDDFVIERGPDAIFTQKPWALDLIKELGLEDRLIEPQAKSFSIVYKAKLVALDSKLFKPYPENLLPVWKCPVLSLKDKILFSIGAKKTIGVDKKDMSLAEYNRKKWGSGFSQKVIEPLFAAVHAGDATRLSMAALYPNIWLNRASKKAKKNSTSQVKKANFISFKNGSEQLIKSLLKQVPVESIEKNTRINAIESRTSDTRDDKKAKLILRSEESSYEFDHVLVAIPASQARRLLFESYPRAASFIGQIEHVSTAVVTLVYESRPESLHGTGFIVPRGSGLTITGVTYSSDKWEGRSPGSKFLVRVFFGRAGDDSFISEWGDDDFKQCAHHELTQFVGKLEQPSKCIIDRWQSGMPHYEVGHLEKIKKIHRELKHTGISFAGLSFEGVGIPDCIRQAKEWAKTMGSTKNTSS